MSGLNIWVFGMVERASNTLIMYPVNDRSRSTLLPIIKRHVAPGSTIYSNGWSAYCDLYSEGYRHFTVIHKYTFKSFYWNVETGDFVEVHTNRIEGALRHAKTHFRKISGTKLTQFEGHLAEVGCLYLIHGTLPAWTTKSGKLFPICLMMIIKMMMRYHRKLSRRQSRQWLQLHNRVKYWSPLALDSQASCAARSLIQRSSKQELL